MIETGELCRKQIVKCVHYGKDTHASLKCRFKNTICHACKAKGHIKCVCLKSRAQCLHVMNDNDVLVMVVNPVTKCSSRWSSSHQLSMTNRYGLKSIKAQLFLLYPEKCFRRVLGLLTWIRRQQYYKKLFWRRNTASRNENGKRVDSHIRWNCTLSWATVLRYLDGTGWVKLFCTCEFNYWPNDTEKYLKLWRDISQWTEGLTMDKWFSVAGVTIK